MDDTDILRAAHMMIELYAKDAGWRAGLRGGHLLNDGDQEGFRVWVRIARAINELQKNEPEKET